MITFMTIEGVLAKSDDLKTAQPTKWAQMLYTGFRSQHQMVMLTQADDTISRWWLRREHFHESSRVLTWNNALDWDTWKVDQVRETLAEGWEVFAFIDTDLTVVEAVRALGVAAIYIGYPDIAPGWKDVSTPRNWADVVTTMDATP